MKISRRLSEKHDQKFIQDEELIFEHNWIRRINDTAYKFEVELSTRRDEAFYRVTRIASKEVIHQFKVKYTEPVEF